MNHFFNNRGQSMVTAYDRDINETNKVSLLFPPENCRSSPEKSFPPELFSRMFLRILSRHCAISVAAAADWDTKFVLDDYCIREIQFWKNNLHRLNTKNIDLAPISSNYVIYSDASATGCSAHIYLNVTQIYICHKQWNEDECKKIFTPLSELT